MKKIIIAIILSLIPVVASANQSPTAAQIATNCTPWSKNLNCTMTNQQLVDNAVDQLSSGGGSQTPWTSTINGNGHSLINAGNIGIGSAVPGQALDAIGTIRASSNIFIGTQPVCQANGTNCPPSGSGTVTTISVNSANGLAGTVANPTTTPALTLSTTITGILKGNGTAISAATSGTDYAPATSGSSILYGNSGGFSNVSIGTGMVFSGGTISTNIITPTGANPSATIGLSAVNGSASTYMRSDAAPVLGVTISPTWTGNHNFAPSSGNTLFSTGNVGVGSATPGQLMDVAGTVRALSHSVPGGLSTQFMKANGTLDSNAYLTGNQTITVSGDISGSGTTAITATLPTVNNNIGTFQGITVNGKGQVTAATNQSYGTGSVTSVTLATPNSTLTLGGTNPVTTSGTINADINLTHANTWTGLQNFTVANVGIGSASPGQSLDAQGTVRDIGEIVNGNVGIGTSFVNGAGEGALTVMNGNVGVGTWLPAGALDVEGTLSKTILNGNVGIDTLSPPNQLYVNGFAFLNNALYGTEIFASATSITPSGNFRYCYMANTQGIGTFTVNATTNTPMVNGQVLVLKISSTSVQTFSWASGSNGYNGGSVGLPTTTLGTSTIQYFYFTWDAINSKWDYNGSVSGF